MKHLTQHPRSAGLLFVKNWRISKGALACLATIVALGGPNQALATLYCNRPYSELTVNPGMPYNAVGYLNNGCTAFLIDANHVAAAAHCFADPGTGAWFPSVRFYPNFHPSRVTTNEHHVPRADVTRAVVGSRVDRGMGSGMDWAIARVGNWQDVAGLNLTPVPLYGGTPTVGMPLSSPAYTRHHFPYNDNDAVAWDNMEWDKTFCGRVGESSKGKNDGGMWAVRMGTAPFIDAVNRDSRWCNARWRSGMIHTNCSLKSLPGGVVIHNCNLIGGSSGSPILYQARNGTWSVVGVNHGGGTAATAAANDFSLTVPKCAADVPANHDNGGASVERFRHAPRFAENVAVHRRPDKSSATAVFAVDSDRNRVAYRARKANAAKYDGEFDYWQDLGGPPVVGRGSKLTQIAACSADASLKPQVFVVLNDSQIFTRSVLPNGSWSAWTDFGAPNSGGVVDIDAASDAKGRCQLFAVGKSGGVFARSKASDTAWNANWGNVASGTYKRISALNVDSTLWVAAIDPAGDISRISAPAAGGGIWIPPMKLARPAGVTWRDIDFTWDEAGRGFLVALPTTASNKLWFMPMYGSKAWVEWRFFDTHLWAPDAKDQNGVSIVVDAPKLQSVTASRWMEDPAGTTSPVVFATDDRGNVYFIEYARVGAPRWVLDWKSFYHETIVY